jgi:hypothetical protein
MPLFYRSTRHFHNKWGLSSLRRSVSRSVAILCGSTACDSKIRAITGKLVTVGKARPTAELFFLFLSRRCKGVGFSRRRF